MIYAGHQIVEIVNYFIKFNRWPSSVHHESRARHLDTEPTFELKASSKMVAFLLQATLPQVFYS